MGARPRHVSVGRVLKPHGLKGEVKVEPFTPDPGRFGELGRVFAIGPGGRRESFAIEGSRPAGQGILLKLAGVDTPEAAAALSGRVLEIPRSEARRPPPGEVLFADMIGLLAIEAEQGTPIGRITGIVTAGNDLLEIEGSGGEILVPWVPEFVGSPDLAAGTVEIRPIPGLLEP